MIYKVQMQTAFKKSRQQNPENYDNEPLQVLPPDRVPKLSEIVDLFLTGRPIDTSLELHLDYIDIEDLALLKKGVDLADLPRIARENGKQLSEAMEEIEKYNLARKKEAEQVQTPPVEEPIPVATE